MSASLPVVGLGLLAAVEPHDVREELDLLGREVAVRAVDLAEDVPGVDEQHLVGALGVASCPGRRTTACTGSVTV